MRAIGGYNLAATTNGARFQAEVLLALAQRAYSRDPDGPPLFIGHADWFAAYVHKAALTAEQVPRFARLADEFGQDITLEYRLQRVLRSRSRDALRAMNVEISWPGGPNAPGEYSYEDASSTPRLRVTNKRLIRYRLVEVADMVVFDDVSGLTGRPTSGLLGLLFQLIGEGRILEYRFAVSSDGLQISYGRAKKAFIEVDSTVTVQPDGRSEKGLPPGRPDLRLIEARLKRPIDVDYQPWP